MDTVLLFVVYVLLSVVIQPSWLPNPIKFIIIIYSNPKCGYRNDELLIMPRPRREGKEA